MNPFSDLSQIPTVSDSPEETPEDLLRQQMMQRLGVALNPQAVAQQATAERLGQTGKGVGGWLQRILGGAAEGVRFAQDPKYRGAFAEELTRAQEQEKNLMPYARQLEVSSAMREKARLEAREKERATTAKVFATIKQDAQAKIKSDIQRAKVNQEIEESEAKIKLLQSQNNFNEAREELQRMQNKLFEKIGRTQASEAMSNAAMLQDVSKFTDMTGAQAKQGLVDMSLAKAAGPAILKFLGVGNRGGGGTRVSESMRPIITEGPDGKARVEYFPVRSTSFFTGGGNQTSANPQTLSAFGISPDIINKLGAPGQPASAPQAQTPQDISASTLGVKKPALVKVPAPVGSVSASPTARPPSVQLEGYKNAGAAKAAAMRASVQNQASEVRSLLGSDLDLIEKIGAIRGNPTMLELQKKAQDLGLSRDFSNNFIQFQQRATELELTKRYEFTGKASNSTEMKEIKSFSPNTGDTYKQALTKAIGLEIATKYHNKLLESGNLKTPYPPGRMSQIAKDISDYYFDAAKYKDPEVRKARLAEIEEMLTPEFIWDAMTRTRKKKSQ